ncbi:MAG TPA: hypothetical protein VHC19_00720 [Pirellulales bacterium]|nr:hypothetical protein [Pirellulales bacterium]
MTSVLITAFEPYDRWQANSSWLCLMELTRDRPTQPAITTRRYPVDFQAAKERLAQDCQWRPRTRPVWQGRPGDFAVGRRQSHRPYGAGLV